MQSFKQLGGCQSPAMKLTWVDEIDTVFACNPHNILHVQVCPHRGFPFGLRMKSNVTQRVPTDSAWWALAWKRLA